VENILVMKFGGTSVGSAQRIAAAAAIVKDFRGGRPSVVVASAMSGVTDLLVKSAQAAARGGELSRRSGDRAKPELL